MAWSLAQLAGICVVVAAHASFAQPLPAAAGSADRPAFEVASVRRTDEPAINNVFRVEHGNLTCHTMGLRYITAWAYGVPFFQLIAPDWTLQAAVNIEAKAAYPAEEDQVRLMLRTLLEERFKLTVHHETRDSTVLALMVGKGGPRPKPSESAGPWSRKFDGMTYRETFTAITMKEFAEQFLAAYYPGTIDRTGIAGRYDIALNYRPLMDPEETNPTRAVNHARGDALTQVGLKLQAVKAPLDFVVVDHVEKYPTEN